jgi:hypothetical protein
MNSPERLNAAIQLGREAFREKKACFPMEDYKFIRLISSRDKRVPFKVLLAAWETGWHLEYYSPE